MNVRYRVELNQDERDQLNAMLGGGVPPRAVGRQRGHDDTHASLSAVPRNQRIKPVTAAPFEVRAGDLQHRCGAIRSARKANFLARLGPRRDRGAGGRSVSLQCAPAPR